MGKSQRRATTQTRRKGRINSAVKWIAGLAVLAVAGYGITQMSSVAFDEDDIKVVNFQGLSAGQKRRALEEANTARCTCGCGLGLAQCVSVDLTCPIRDSNIERIKGMVRSALATGVGD